MSLCAQSSYIFCTYRAMGSKNTRHQDPVGLTLTQNYIVQRGYLEQINSGIHRVTDSEKKVWLGVSLFPAKNQVHYSYLINLVPRNELPPSVGYLISKFSEKVLDLCYRDDSLIARPFLIVPIIDKLKRHIR
jgi:hypothetical protein